MKKATKTIALVIAVVMLVSAFPATAFAAEASEGLEFISRGDGTCYVNSIGTCTDTDVIIPSVSPEGDLVTYIGDAFKDCTHLTSITIPNSVTSIGATAFWNCTKLTSITIPNSVISIGENAFYNCRRLTSITIPDSVTSIEEDAFSNTGYYNNTSNWENGVLYIDNCLIEAEDTISDSYQIKEGTVCIGDKAFYNCKRLTSITIPDSVTSIGKDTFWNCTGLASITIHDSVASIGNHAFAGCSGLTSIALPDSVTSIGRYAFYHCTGLTDIIIPNGVKSIGEWAFADCTGLTSITLPDSVTTIDSYAFYYCSELTSITIPRSVTSIAYKAFLCCPKLTSITVDSENTQYHSVGNCLIETASKTLIAGCNNCIIPDDGSVTNIGESAFSGSVLESINIPGSITYISGYAFKDCSYLHTIYYEGTEEQWKNIQFGPECFLATGQYTENGTYTIVYTSVADSTSSETTEPEETTAPEETTVPEDTTVVEDTTESLTTEFETNELQKQEDSTDSATPSAPGFGIGSILSGCMGSVSISGLALISALGTCTAFVTKKKKD